MSTIDATSGSETPADDSTSAPSTPLARLEEPKVTTLELFFDLVFVFALTQVTLLMAEEVSWTNLVRGLAVLAIIWWSWVGFSWMTNYVRADDGLTRLSIFASMGAVLVVSIATPRAFGEWGVQFGAAYLVLILLFLVTYGVAARREPAVLSSILKLAPGVLIAPILVLAAGFLEEGPLRAALWAIAIAVAYLAGLAGSAGWRLSPGHFTERHGLVVIIALGESIVSIGVGAASGDEGMSAIVVIGALLALVVACCLWWLYFDVVALVAERRLHSAPAGVEQNRIARDGYSYLHYLLIAGIILVALGIKKVLIYIDKPLPTVALVALLGGLALYLVGHALFRLRVLRSVSIHRLVAAAALLVLIPAMAKVDAWVVLVVACAVMVALVAYEFLHFHAFRHAVRHVEPSSHS